MDEMLRFRKNALLNGLCKEWATMWSGCHGNVEKLVRLGLMQQSLPFFITYCNEGKGLSKKYILEHWRDEINGKVHYNCDVDKDTPYLVTHALWVGWRKDLALCNDINALMWCSSNKEVYLPTGKGGNLYLGCGSRIRMRCGGFNSMRVYLFDRSEVEVTRCPSGCDITIYKYSPSAKVTIDESCLGKVKAFDKELKL